MTSLPYPQSLTTRNRAFLASWHDGNYGLSMVATIYKIKVLDFCFPPWSPLFWGIMVAEW
ncbi:MAG: hypothetical protein AMJ45_05400 [Syntrophobacter sp. DG_60]|nr:MAG: hypothetical protein AMJ45_05400 [Syntrophobacter sp. DG_60]